MFAVIFRATMAGVDEEYARMATRLRDLAVSQYGCLEFTAVMQGKEEIAISYWPDEAHILAWKNDPEHKVAQQNGMNRWYTSYSVEICEIQRRYQNDAS